MAKLLIYSTFRSQFLQLLLSDSVTASVNGTRCRKISSHNTHTIYWISV